MSECEILEKLKATQKERRYKHTLGVADEAVRLADVFGVDKKKARIAALLHDCAKNLDEKSGENFESLCKKYDVIPDEYAKKEKALVHAFLGAAVARYEYGIEDEEILNAIYYHTTAHANMTPLEKLIYIADMTESGRTIPYADELRRLAEKNPDEAMIFAIGSSIKYVISKGTLLHPDSVHALNYFINSRRDCS